MLIYFLRGTLPWQSHKDTEPSDTRGDNENAKHQMILAQKRAFIVDSYLEIDQYFRHIRSLVDNQQPNYVMLRRKFRQLFKRSGFEYDHVFDWTILKSATVVR